MQARRQTISAAVIGVAGLLLAAGLAGCGRASSAATTPAASPVTTQPATPITRPATTSSSSAAAVTTSTPTVATATPAPTVSATSAATSQLPALELYTNARFGFTVSHPGAPDTLEQQPPPTDGDGLLWSTGGVGEQAYGDDNINHETTAQVLADASEGVQVTYRSVIGDRVVVSGLLEGAIVYRLDVVGAGSIDTLEWSYPTSMRATWDPVVTATADAFRPGDVAIGH